MAKDYDYEKIVFTQKVPNGNLRSDQWGSLKEMYRDMKPEVTYATFHNRIRRGWDPMTAATKPRDSRGRRTGRLPQSS